MGKSGAKKRTVQTGGSKGTTNTRANMVRAEGEKQIATEMKKAATEGVVNPFAVKETVPAKSEGEIHRTLDALSGVSGVVNGPKKAVADFMAVPSASNARISEQLMSMASAIVRGVETINPKLVASSLNYVAHIKGTTRSAETASTGNVLRAVGNHLHKAVSWGAKPKATYNTFINAYNSARKEGAEPTVALEMAIGEAFGLKGNKVAAKKREIFELCRA